MFVEALEHFKCDELTRALCQSWQNFDAFDHFSMMKEAETFCGCGHPPSSATCQRWHPVHHPRACYRPKTSHSCTRAWSWINDEQQTLSNNCVSRRRTPRLKRGQTEAVDEDLCYRFLAAGISLRGIYNKVLRDVSAFQPTIAKYTDSAHNKCRDQSSFVGISVTGETSNLQGRHVADVLVRTLQLG